MAMSVCTLCRVLGSLSLCLSVCPSVRQMLQQLL